MSWFRRMRERMGQSDEERLREETRQWAAEVAGATPIGSCERRSRCRIAGVVRRMTIRPGEESLEALVTDGTGEVVAVWTGRSHIPGVGLGTRVLLEGMVVEEKGRLRVVNPGYEFVGSH
ncbi:MAG TPA: DNA-binding protein [Actinomycetota bacterium]|nr:DNA-binding protein [Actinomycetota bacterium]